MKSNKIAIMGCGWLGFPLAKHLLKNGYLINGSTTKEEKINQLRIAGIQPYLLTASPELKGTQLPDFFNVKTLILNIPPGRRRSDVEVFHLQQIKSIVIKAEAHGIEKFIFLSSTSVYGDQNKEVTESTQLLPNTASSRALKEVEEWLKSLDLEVTILRLGGLVGEDRKAGRFLAGKKNVKNGQTPVNLLHQDDGINIIHQIIKQEKWGEIFNCCSDEHPTREAFYTAQAIKQNFEPPTFLPEPSSNFKIVSNQKIKKSLNYTFQYPNPMGF